MDNLFEFVQALTLAHNMTEGLPTVNPDDKKTYVQQVGRAKRIKSGAK